MPLETCQSKCSKQSKIKQMTGSAGGSILPEFGEYWSYVIPEKNFIHSISIDHCSRSSEQGHVLMAWLSSDVTRFKQISFRRHNNEFFSRYFDVTCH